MINQGKVMLMTKIAIYEKKHENGDLVMSRYFREDYIKFGCLKTLVVTTICYWIFVGVSILMNFEKLLNDISNMDYFSAISGYLKGYVVVCLFFFVYAFIIYLIKFQVAKPGIVEYNRTLRKLLKYYEIEQREIDKINKKIRVYSSIGGEEEQIPLDSDVVSEDGSASAADETAEDTNDYSEEYVIEENDDSDDIWKKKEDSSDGDRR